MSTLEEIESALKVIGSGEPPYQGLPKEVKKTAVEAQDALNRLRLFAEAAAEKSGEPGTRAAAKIALTGTLQGYVDELRRSQRGGMSESGMLAVLFVCVTLLIILFIGEPDMHDAIVVRLMRCGQ